MSKKVKFTIEFPVRCSPAILFDFLSTANGLGEWFADHVDQIDKTFIFNWSGTKESADMIEKIENKLVKFRWENMAPSEYFEFKIERNDVINDTELIITDFADKNDVDSQRQLWETQVHELKHRIGS